MKDSPAASPSTNALPAPSGRTSQFSPFNKTNPWLPEYHSAEMRNAHPGRAALRRPRSGANCDLLFSRASPGRSAVLTRHRRLAGWFRAGTEVHLSVEAGIFFCYNFLERAPKESQITMSSTKQKL